MELKETIENRRSIRKYQAMDVPDILIEDLIDCARLAPSAKNRQPWEFLVIRGETKNKIADIMLENELATRQTTDTDLIEKKSSVPTTARVIREAPVLILVFKEYNENWTTGDTLSIGGAVEHICLRATDMGLGSLWIRDTVYTQKEIAKLVEEEKELICAISIGYPNQDPHQRPRKELSEILKWYEE